MKSAVTCSSTDYFHEKKIRHNFLGYAVSLFCDGTLANGLPYMGAFVNLFISASKIVII